MTTVNTTSIATATKAARKVPKGTMNKIETALPITGTSFFDPIDTLEDTMGNQPVLHSRVLDSLVWMLDNSCISQARSIFFERYKECDHTSPNAFDDFRQDVAENLDHPSLYGEDNEGSPEHTLSILMALRDQWHDAAARASAADDRDYKPKSLRELMASEKIKPADVGTRVNYRVIADAEGMGDTAKADRLYASYMEADALGQAQRVDSNKALMPTVLEVLRTVKRYAAESSRFDHLPLVVQRRLTNFLLGAVARSRMDVAKRLSKQPIAFGHANEAAHQATIALNHVLATKFSDAGEMENITSQVAIDLGRNAKRVASID